jgi:hypothetical protein
MFELDKKTKLDISWTISKLKQQVHFYRKRVIVTAPAPGMEVA